MQTEQITIEPKTARELWREYRKCLHYSTPIDDEIRRAYQLLAQGRLVIRALDSIRAAGLKPDGFPKLALSLATVKRCHVRINGETGVAEFKDADNAWSRKAALTIRIDPGFGRQPWFDPRRSWEDKTGRAIVPIVPAMHRPKRALENYHILWEAEWTKVPPVDPFLLRRIGKADMWLVVAMWDLTEVERAALATRMNG
jgi:hypothetical protein